MGWGPPATSSGLWSQSEPLSSVRRRGTGRCSQHTGSWADDAHGAEEGWTGGLGGRVAAPLHLARATPPGACTALGNDAVGRWSHAAPSKDRASGREGPARRATCSHPGGPREGLGGHCVRLIIPACGHTPCSQPAPSPQQYRPITQLTKPARSLATQRGPPNALLPPRAGATTP